MSVPPLSVASNTLCADCDRADAEVSAGGDRERIASAVVYCEANFGAIDGKTANGLVRHSEKYKILSVIDSEKAGLNAGMVLDDEPNAPQTVLVRLDGEAVEVLALLVAVLSASYVTAGGQTSVIMTDLLQGVMLLFVGLLIFWLGVWVGSAFLRCAPTCCQKYHRSQQ